jgi:hypothetical protein
VRRLKAEKRPSEPRHQGVRLRRLAIGANDLDARGRSPMCHQRIHLSLGGEAGGRSLGFICRRGSLLQLHLPGALIEFGVDA